MDSKTISTKRTDFQTDLVLLLGQVTEKEEKANPSHFLKFLLAIRTLAHLVLPDTQANEKKPKEPFFATASRIMKILTDLKTLINNNTIK